ncbi:MAG: hypothetical protein R2769_11745 [Saprospiraceae bacterium]
MIVSKAAVLFNRQGVSGTSMSDIMEVTGFPTKRKPAEFQKARRISRSCF